MSFCDRAILFTLDKSSCHSFNGFQEGQSIIALWAIKESICIFLKTIFSTKQLLQFRGQRVPTELPKNVAVGKTSAFFPGYAMWPLTSMDSKFIPIPDEPIVISYAMIVVTANKKLAQNLSYSFFTFKLDKNRKIFARRCNKSPCNQYSSQIKLCNFVLKRSPVMSTLHVFLTALCYGWQRLLSPSGYF
jgi:hypothetical protein